MASSLVTRLKKLRVQKDLTQRALASRLDVIRPYIVMLETGKRINPLLQLPQRLAKALEIPLKALLGGP